MKRKWVTLRVMTVNVHMGTGLPSAVAWLLRKFPGIHIVFLQEVSRPPARRGLGRVFPRSKWLRMGPKDQAKDPLVGTFVVAKRKRFDLERKVNRKISDAQPKVDGKDMFPQRNLNGGVLRDKRTGRQVVVSSIHNWHMVGRQFGGKGPVMRGHVRQTRAVARFHSRNYMAGQVNISAGDTNEALDSQAQQHQDSITTIMWNDARMVPALRGRAHLDDVFYREEGYVKVKTSVVIPAFGPLDHPVVVTTFKVRRLD